MARKVIWSPVEDEFLTANLEHFTIKQLAVMLAKSETAIRAHLRGEETVEKRGRFKGGPKDDLPGISVRSLWEANCLRWLTYGDVNWEYEPRRFHFEGAPRGAKSYLPDIWLPDSQQFIEVKGRLMSSDKTRIKRFKKYYPTEFAQLVAIPGSDKDEAALFFKSMDIPCIAYYRELDREFKDLVPCWGT